MVPVPAGRIIQPYSNTGSNRQQPAHHRFTTILLLVKKPKLSSNETQLFPLCIMMMDLAGDGEQTQYPVVGGGHPQGLLPDDDTLSLSFLNSNSPLQHHEHAAMMADGGTPTTTLPPHRVDHTYRDFSNFPLEELPTRKRAPSNFPSKLHQILSNPEYAHVS